jgi:DNA repair protein RecO (recombination protein O)
MTKRFVLQPAFVLHSRRYNETSALVDLFTFPEGRVTAIARGSRFRGILRPFVPLLISGSAKTELMNLSVAEINGAAFELSGHRLFSGMYLNELLVRLLQRYDPHPELFMAYQQTLAALESHHENMERQLRLFERELLSRLGYGISLDKEAESGAPILPDGVYYFDPQRGFYKSEFVRASFLIFKGKHLLAFNSGVLVDEGDLRAAKQLMRVAIEFLLGKSPRSRELFV